MDTEAKPNCPENEENAIFPVTVQTLIFHGIMCLTVLYFGMLFTNWGDAVIEDDSNNSFAKEMFSCWVKIVAQWLTIALFVVSFTLNICCKDRIL